MSKRNGTDSRASRKRKKGGATYSSLDFDAFNKKKGRTEEIRVWNVSMSESGRVSATRKNQHYVYTNPPEPSPQELPTVDESFAAAEDPESGELPPAKSATTRRRTKLSKENDSVSSGRHLWLS